MKTCYACGYEVVPADRSCSSCGASQDSGDVRVSRAAGAGAAQPDAAAKSQGYYPPQQFAPLDGDTAGQGAPVPLAAIDVPAGIPVPAGFGTPQTTCPNCGQAWTGSQSCAFCGQVWGLPQGTSLASAGRRFGGYLLEFVLIVCTLVIGWVIWSLIVWAQGQTPAKQLLGMRVVRLDQRTYAGWGRMFLREFVGKGIVWLVGSLVLIGPVVADLWLLWDEDKQELWDKIAGTVVVNDPGNRL